MLNKEMLELAGGWCGVRWAGGWWCDGMWAGGWWCGEMWADGGVV